MMTLTPPYVSVIIAVYNDAERLKICLQRLEEQTYPRDAYEVLVVDNGSDESPESVVVRFSQAKLFYETATRGPAAARNKGVVLAQGEVIAFTDSDCIPAPDWLERGVVKLRSVPNCGIVGGRINMFFKNPDRPTVVEVYDSVMYLNQKAYIERASFGATANLFTYKHIFAQVGNFAIDLVMSDDKEWGRRVALAGYRLIYADNVCVAHPARYSLSELFTKERRVAIGGAAADRGRKKSIPFVMRSYNFLIDHVPPVITTSRLENVSFMIKIQVIGLWFMVRFVRLKAQLHIKLMPIVYAYKKKK